MDEKSSFSGLLEANASALQDNRAKSGTHAKKLRPIKWVVLSLSLLSFHLWTRTSTQALNVHPPTGKEAEQLFLAIPNEDSAIQASRQYATIPHLAGTAGDLTTATDFLRLLQRELGISSPTSLPIFPAGTHSSRNATLSISELKEPQAWIDVYYPVLNTPLDRSLEILDDDGHSLWKADLEERSDATDKDAYEYATSVPAFHGLSRGGEVQGKLVYANYGRKEDYDALVAKGVNLTGAVVITRYGGIFRGLKVKGAQELGAVGVLVYSDPLDDGTVTAENGYTPYPHGPARNPTSVQRGSVQFLSIYPGDPTTPGYPAYKNSTRTEGTNIPVIPSIPISWANAEVLLKTLVEGEPWVGKQVRLVNHVNNTMTPIWNTLGVIPGHIKDEVVVIGNHRDAWVLGATDPSSGTASFHEVVRGLGVLLKQGWKPLRTILIASWDAEEYGLIGSTEWGEDFPEWINDHVVAYLNLDSSVSGSRFRASASPLLAHLIRNTAQEIPHPTDTQGSRSLWDATNDDGKLFGKRSDGKVVLDAEAVAVYDQSTAVIGIGVSPLGSGSDYTVFLQRSGIASTNGGFGATLHDPVYHYHSVFDSERWQELYGDPGFFRHVAVAKHLGLQTLRLSNDIVLPFNTTHYAHDLEIYLEKVEGLALKRSLDLDLSILRKSIVALQDASASLDDEKEKAEQNLKDIIERWNKRHTILRKIKRKLRRAYCRLGKILGHKCDRHLVSGNACQFSDQSRHGRIVSPRVGRFAAWWEEANDRKDYDLVYALAKQAWHDGEPLFHKRVFRKLRRAVKRVQAVNAKLRAFEKGFISEEGIKDREWYKHLAVAPGKWLGYGATTFPGLTEAIQFEKNATLAKYEAGRLTNLIDKLVEHIRVD